MSDSYKQQGDLERLIAAVLQSNKYRDISPELIRNVGEQELRKRRNVKEAIKETKNKLHQVGGAYLLYEQQAAPDERTIYTRWLSELDTAQQAEEQATIRQVSARIMAQHASTRERLPILDQFYATLFATLPPIHSVLDIACGLNPLALPWMSLADGAEYYAYDIYQHMMDFLQGYLQLRHMPGRAEARDIIQHCPTHSVDLALVLKALPCLEQLDKRATLNILQQLNARYIIVSYPLHSLGGKSKGMAAYYESHFNTLIADRDWKVQKFAFATELVFVVQK